MKLSTVIESLVYGELSNLHYVDEGKLIPEKRAAVVSAVNLGLLKLHTRFLIKKKFENITVVANIQNYVLGSQDILSLVSVESSDGVFYNIGKDFIRTSSNSFKIADSVDPGVYTVCYIAGPQPVTLVGSFDEYPFENVDIDLPDAYLNALLYFVGSRLQNNAGIGRDLSKVGGRTSDLSFIEKYEAECKLLEFRGVSLDSDQIPSNVFNDRGFV